MSLTLEQQLKQDRARLQDRLKSVHLLIHAHDAPIEGFDDPNAHPASPAEVTRLNSQQGVISRRIADLDQQIAAENARLRRLHYWLTVESVGGISTIVIVKGSFYLFVSLALPMLWWYSVLIAAAVAFMPLLLRTLIRSRRSGWLTLFCVMVVVPCGVPFIPINDEYFDLAFKLFPLLMFYSYCVLLRHAVEDWLD